MKKSKQTKKKNIPGRILVSSILVGGLALGGFYGVNYLRQKDNLIAEQTDRIVEQNSTIDELTLQNANLGEQIATLQAQKLILEGERDSALSTLNARTQERDAEIALKNQALADKDAALAEANRLNGVIADINEEKAELESELADELLANSQNLQIINGLQADIVTLNNIKAGLENSLAIALSDVTTLEGQILTHQNTINQKNAEITTLNQSVTSLNAQLAALNSNITTLQNKLTTAESVMNFLIQPMQYELTPTVQNNILNFEPLFNALSSFNASYDIKLDGISVAEGTQNHTLDLSSFTNGIAAGRNIALLPFVEYNGLKFPASYNYYVGFTTAGYLPKPVIDIDYYSNYAYLGISSLATSFDLLIYDDLGNLLVSENFMPWATSRNLSSYGLQNGYRIAVKAIGNGDDILDSEVAIVEYFKVEKIQLAAPTNIQIDFENKTMNLPEVEGLVGYNIGFLSFFDGINIDENSIIGSNEGIFPGTFTYTYDLQPGAVIVIMAVGNQETHTDSEFAYYPFPSQLQQLVVPTPLEVNFATQELMIPAVENAVGYRVVLNNSNGEVVTQEVESTATTFAMADYNLQNQSIIQVFALGDGVTYSDSEGVQYVLEYQQLVTPTITYDIDRQMFIVSNIDTNGISSDNKISLQLDLIVSSTAFSGINVVDGVVELYAPWYSNNPNFYKDVEYQISVKLSAFKWFKDSEYSSPVSFVNTWAAQTRTQYTTPSLLIDENSLTATVTLGETYTGGVSIQVWHSVSETSDYISQAGMNGYIAANSNSTTFNLKGLSQTIENGSYYFKVKLVSFDSAYTDSEFSNAILVNFNVTKFDTPILNYDETTKILSWNQPEQKNGYLPESYSISIVSIPTNHSYAWGELTENNISIYGETTYNGSIDQNYNGCSLDLSLFNLEQGSYSISIRANASLGEANRLWNSESSSITFVVV